ncbi:uncharacterized protein V6R79_001155 [Siganus canaliculatus]
MHCDRKATVSPEDGAKRTATKICQILLQTLVVDHAGPGVDKDPNMKHTQEKPSLNRRADVLSCLCEINDDDDDVLRCHLSLLADKHRAAACARISVNFTSGRTNVTQSGSSGFVSVDSPSSVKNVRSHNPLSLHQVLFKMFVSQEPSIVKSYSSINLIM